MPIDRSCRFRTAFALSIFLILTGGAPVTPAEIVVEGGCTLADAITAANDDEPTGGCPAGSGADDIILTGDVVLTEELPGTSFTSTVTIHGNGFTVSRDPGAPEFRIFTAGVGPTAGETDPVLVESGLSSLTIDNTTVSGGIANSGGGIYSKVELAIHNSTVTGNAAGFDGGGIGMRGGSLALTHSTVSYNTAVHGGGMHLDGDVDIAYSRIENNLAEARGGAIHQAEGHATIARSALVDNLVEGGSGAPGHNAGGGLFTYYASATLVSSTVSGNSILEGNGGGIMAYYGNVTLENTTVSGNSASSGHAVFAYFGTVTLFGSIANGSCSGYYIFDGGASFGCGFGGTLTGFDNDLAENGGPTPTHALLAGSSAIDLAGTFCEGNDQRGFGRSGDCDTGAYEFEGTRPAIGGTQNGLDNRQGHCGNRTTHQRIDLLLGGAAGWDCEAEGLVATPGDEVEQSVTGRVPPAGIEGVIAGSVTGMRLRAVECSNLSSGDRLPIRPAGLATEWNCTVAGLEVAAGDRIRVTVRGSAD